MDNTLLTQLTEQMLQKHRIISLQQMQEVMEVDGNDLPPVLYIKYDNGKDEYIKGEANINNFINNIIASR